ncbi:hypothetical protein AMECASPLE_032241 [Ameca splendens]|uniref:Uncharacterized protein n=1 Tax=Ameca splendens TaxID=208324 RepID=A0ABV0ZHT2_9TELE
MECDVFYLVTWEFQLTLEKFTDCIFSVLLCPFWGSQTRQDYLACPEPMYPGGSPWSLSWALGVAKSNTATGMKTKKHFLLGKRNLDDLLVILFMSQKMQL